MGDQARYMKTLIRQIVSLDKMFVRAQSTAWGIGVIEKYPRAYDWPNQKPQMRGN